MMTGDGVLPSSFFAAKQGATRNILNPLLVLCGIVTPAGFTAAHFASGSTATVLLWAALIFPAATLVAYIYWTFKDPNRLQSEDFVLQQRWIDTNVQIGDNRTQEVIELDANQRRPSINTAGVESK